MIADRVLIEKETMVSFMKKHGAPDEAIDEIDEWLGNVNSRMLEGWQEQFGEIPEHKIISALPPSIGDCKSLTSLNLSDCQSVAGEYRNALDVAPMLHLMSSLQRCLRRLVIVLR